MAWHEVVERDGLTHGVALYVHPCLEAKTTVAIGSNALRATLSQFLLREVETGCHRWLALQAEHERLYKFRVDGAVGVVAVYGIVGYILCWHGETICMLGGEHISLGILPALEVAVVVVVGIYAEVAPRGVLAVCRSAELTGTCGDRLDNHLILDCRHILWPYGVGRIGGVVAVGLCLGTDDEQQRYYI